MKTIIAVLIFIVGGAAGLFGQRAAKPAVEPDTSESQAPRDSVNARNPLTVSLLTCAPGREVYQLEGHTALRLNRLPDERGQGGYDVVVNWGVFDFNSPNFLYRFTKGETDYMAVAYPFELFLREYGEEGREVREQTLDLSEAEARRLEFLVMENLRPENRTYRYNYVADNCATRPLALIEKAVADPIAFRLPQEFEYGETGQRFPADEQSGKETFRREMTRYHRDYPWYQFGIDLALGAGIDRPISQKERSFSPLYLHGLMAGARRADGRPLVVQSQLALAGNGRRITDRPTPWPLRPLPVCCLVLLLIVLVSWRDIRRGRLTRWVDSVLYGAFFLAGMLLTFLIFVSFHEATSPNWLYLWLNPLCIIQAVGVWLKSCKRVVYCYQICNFALLILLLCGHSFLGQALNAAFVPLIVADMVRAAACLWVYGANRQLSRAQ